MSFEKRVLPYLVLLSALMISLSAAFYSVTGIGKMFAGEEMNDMIRIGSLEFAKLVAASFLYQYWDRIHLILRGWYIIAMFVLMAITSGGIYGFLTSAYADTSVKIQTQDREMAIIKSKMGNLKDRLADYQVEKASINDNISQLTEGLSNNKIEYIDKKTGEKMTTTSSSNRKAYQEQLNDAKDRRDKISEDIVKLSEEIAGYDEELVDIEYDPETSGEIGILKSIAELTGRNVEVIINWFIYAIMLVFDPLAISLVIGANIIFKDLSKGKEREELGESAYEKIAELNDKQKEFNNASLEFEGRLKIVEDKESEMLNREVEYLRDIEEKKKFIESSDSEIESKIQEFNKDKLKSQDQIGKEREELSNLKYELAEERAKLAQRKDDYKKEIDIISDSKKDLIEKEMDDKYDKYLKMKKEIEDWQKIHWKIRRGVNPPGQPD